MPTVAGKKEIATNRLDHPSPPPRGKQAIVCNSIDTWIRLHNSAHAASLAGRDDLPRQAEHRKPPGDNGGGKVDGDDLPLSDAVHHLQPMRIRAAPARKAKAESASGKSKAFMAADLPWPNDDQSRTMALQRPTALRTRRHHELRYFKLLQFDIV